MSAENTYNKMKSFGIGDYLGGWDTNGEFSRLLKESSLVIFITHPSINSLGILVWVFFNKKMLNQVLHCDLLK